jgi:hypothetical protein
MGARLPTVKFGAAAGVAAGVASWAAVRIPPVATRPSSTTATTASRAENVCMVHLSVFVAAASVEAARCHHRPSMWSVLDTRNAGARPPRRSPSASPVRARETNEASHPKVPVIHSVAPNGPDSRSSRVAIGH